MDDLIIKSKQQDDIIKKLDVFINSGKIPHYYFMEQMEQVKEHFFSI